MAPKTHKTPQLLRMLTGGASVSNPILDETFKEEIIRSEKNPEPVKPMPAADGGTEINVTAELVSQWLPLVIKRFNLCNCSRCSAEATVEAFEVIKPVIVKVKSDADIKYAQKIKSEKERAVLMELIRLAVARKKLPRHNAG